MLQKRDATIDAMKGLGILFVVMAHAMSTHIFPWRVIQNFHMPLFFFVSGYLFQYDPSWEKYTLKKIRTLYIPFVVVNGVARVSGALSGSNISVPKEIIKTILLVSPASIFGATWFLKVLFVISVAFYFLEMMITKLSGRGCLYAFLIFGCFLIGGLTHVGHNVSTCFTALGFYSCGYVFRNSNLRTQIAKRFHKNIFIILMPITITALVCIGYFFNASFTKNVYDNFGATVIASFCGIYSVWYISTKAKRVRLIVDIGKNSMPILIYQFGAFKLVSLLQILVLHTGFEHIYDFPYYLNSGVWYILLVISGIGIPYALSKILQKYVHGTWIKYCGL